MGYKIKGTSSTQRAVLRLLHLGMSIKEISESRSTSIENTYQVLRRLEDRGLVAKTKNLTSYRVTPTGIEKIKAV